MTAIAVDIRQRLLTRKDAAQVLGVGVSTIDDLCNAGEIEKRRYPRGVGVKIVGASVDDFRNSAGVPVE